MVTPPPLDGWIPARLYWRNGAPGVDWCYLGAQRLVEPFFEQTLGTCVRMPGRMLFRHQTTLQTLEECAALNPGLPPSGFIYHLSRSGSTLVAQMLAELPSHRVVAEASPIDFALRARCRDVTPSPEERVRWLRSVVHCLGRTQCAQEHRYFIKLDSWHTVHLPLLRRAFPDVPWVFLYRDPLGVMASHQRQPGAHVVPGIMDPATGSFCEWNPERDSLLDYMAEVLARICAAALSEATAGDGLLVNYEELPGAVGGIIANHFGIRFDACELATMARRAERDAKHPAFNFSPRLPSLPPSLPDPELARAATRRLQPLYLELESLRLSQRAQPSRNQQHMAG